MFVALRSLCVPLSLTILGACLLTPARAVEGLDYVVPDQDGYGIADCMHAGEACGRVIADSWCESHGHAHATAFGLSDDVTGTTPANATAAPVPAHAVVIHCGD